MNRETRTFIWGLIVLLLGIFLLLTVKYAYDKHDLHYDDAMLLVSGMYSLFSGFKRIYKTID